MLQRCQAWETDEDLDGQKLPRAKRHDDKSLSTPPVSTPPVYAARHRRIDPYLDQERRRCAAPLAHPPPGSALGRPPGTAAPRCSAAADQSRPSRWSCYRTHTSRVSHKFWQRGLCRAPADAQAQAPRAGSGPRTRDLPPAAFLAHRMPPVPAKRASGTLLLPADHGYLYPAGQDNR